MSEAFVETTVLTNLLLKKDGSEKQASAVLNKFAEVSVPQFAWKEFKRGPLRNFAWAHNRLSETKSFMKTLVALQRLSASQHRYLTSTAIQALHTAFVGIFSGLPLNEFGKKYAKDTDADTVLADALRLRLKQLIFTSWSERKRMFGGAQHPLSCYPDADIKDSTPLLKLVPVDCPKDQECCLKNPLLQRKQDVRKVRATFADDEKRQEAIRRRQLLRELEKRSDAIMERRQCQQFGDAYFVFFCPKGATIITTNVRDIAPMAQALKIDVKNPNDEVV